MARIVPFGTQPLPPGYRLPDLAYGGHLDERPWRRWVRRCGFREGTRRWWRFRRLR